MSGLPSLTVRREGVEIHLPLERLRGRFEREGETYLCFDELGERPWLRLDPKKVDVAEVEELLLAAKSAKARAGYREIARPSDEDSRRDLEALFRAVMAGRPVAGAHVVRSMFGEPFGGRWLRAAQAAAFVLCVGGAALLGLGLHLTFGHAIPPPARDPLFRDVVLGTGAGGLGALLGASLVGAMHIRWPWRPAGRRLLLAPAGVVVSLTTGPRAFAWSELAPLHVAPSHFGASVLATGINAPKWSFVVEDALQVRLADGRFLAEVPRSHSAEPLELVAAFGEHLRAAAG